MIDAISDELIPLSKLPVPGRGGKRLNASTAWRWAERGCRGQKLETVLIGGSRFTSAGALRQFLSLINDRPAMANARGASEARASAALKRLDAIGV